MATRIGIMAEIGLDGRGFRAGLLSAEKGLASFAKRVGGYLAAAFSVSVISNQIREMIEHASKINDMSKAIGVTTEEFQQLDYAAKQTGTSIEAFKKGIVTIARIQREALMGAPGNNAALTFERLGISMEQLKKSSPQTLFLKIAEAYNKGSIGVQNMADLMNILGRGNTEVLAAMDEGIGQLMQQFRDLGLVIEDETIAALDNLGDKMTTITSKWQKLRAGAGVIGMESWEKVSELSQIGYNWASTFLKEMSSAKWGDKGVLAKALDKAGQSAAAAVESFVADEENWKDVMAARKARAARMLAIRDEASEINKEFEKQVVVKATKFTPSTDELARIGGFIGGAGTAISIAREHLNETKGVRREVTKIAGFVNSQW